MTAYIVLLGMVCWLTTNIVVDSEIFRPLRSWVSNQRYFAKYGERRPTEPFGALGATFKDAIDRMVRAFGKPPAHPRRYFLFDKLHYLLTCHLCSGTWIALALVTVQPDARPFGTGFIGWLLAGLLVKAVAHLVLEAVAYLKRETSAPVANNIYNDGHRDINDARYAYSRYGSD